MNETEKVNLVDQLLQDISRSINSFLKKMDIKEEVLMYTRPTVKADRITVKELVDIVDQDLTSKLGDSVRAPIGIRSKCRVRGVVIRRQIVCYLARRLGYSLNHIGDVLDINHATVIHSAKSVGNLMQTKDTEMIATYKNIRYLLNEYNRKTYGKDFSEIN